MINRRYFFLIPAFLFLSACHNSNHQTASPAAKVSRDSTETKKDRLLKLDLALRKDPACGMPLTAGLEDTVHYKGKLYGFCSEECKKQFLQNPEAYLSKK
ncbi:MAG TPA: YHS domain-containing protein [Puia sp.]|nr:YHS domain-containing protein [Puia sp.]